MISKIILVLLGNSASCRRAYDVVNMDIPFQGFGYMIYVVGRVIVTASSQTSSQDLKRWSTVKVQVHVGKLGFEPFSKSGPLVTKLSLRRTDISTFPMQSVQASSMP
jgi:hypothetical protein